MCSPSHGTRDSGPSATFDSFTGLPGISTGGSTPSVRSISTSMLRCEQVRVDDDLGGGLARRRGDARGGELRGRLELGLAARPTPRSRGGARLEVAAQPSRSASRGSSSHSGWPTTPASRSNWCSRTSCITNQPSVARNESRIEPRLRCSASMPIDKKFVTMSVMATVASYIAMSTCWPSPVRVAVAQRGEHADDREQRRADVAERADRVGTRRLVLVAHEVVDPRHRLGDRRVRRPVGVRRLAGCRSPRPTRRRAGVRAAAIVVVAEAQAVERAGLEVLGEHVEVRRQAQHEVAAGGGLEVDGDAALAEVVAQERGADRAAVGIGHPRLRRRGPTRRVGGLDLHHVGAEPREQLRARTAAPASARARARARRRAACRSAPRRRWRCLRPSRRRAYPCLNSGPAAPVAARPRGRRPGRI